MTSAVQSPTCINVKLNWTSSNFPVKVDSAVDNASECYQD